MKPVLWPTIFFIFFELVGVARLPKRLVTCFPTGLLPMKSHKSDTSNLYFSYSYPISTLPSKGPSKVLNLEGAQSNTDDAIVSSIIIVPKDHASMHAVV
jgi:hypothetical protein